MGGSGKNHHSFSIGSMGRLYIYQHLRDWYMDLHIDHKNQQYTVRPMDPSMGFWGEFWDRIISGFFRCLGLKIFQLRSHQQQMLLQEICGRQQGNPRWVPEVDFRVGGTTGGRGLVGHTAQPQIDMEKNVHVEKYLAINERYGEGWRI